MGSVALGGAPLLRAPQRPRGGDGGDGTCCAGGGGDGVGGAYFLGAVAHSHPAATVAVVISRVEDFVPVCTGVQGGAQVQVQAVGAASVQAIGVLCVLCRYAGRAAHMVVNKGRQKGV